MLDVEIDENDSPIPLGAWMAGSYTAVVVSADWNTVRFVTFEAPIRVHRARLEFFVLEWRPRLDMPAARLARAYLDSGLARHGGITNEARDALRDLAGRTPAEIAEELLG